MTCRLRVATVADAAAIARVHVACWHETYPGIMPPELISRLLVTDRTDGWTRMLGNPSDYFDQRVFVAEAGGELAGFGSCGRQRDEDLARAGFDGEIIGLYVLRSEQKSGVGTALMDMMDAELTERGFSLWVLRDNTVARRFYERRGGQLVDEKRDNRGDAALQEAAYGWQPRSRADLFASNTVMQP